MSVVQEHVSFRFELVLWKVPHLVPLALLKLHLLFYELTLRVDLVQIAQASLVRICVNSIQIVLRVVHVPLLTHTSLAANLQLWQLLDYQGLVCLLFSMLL